MKVAITGATGLIGSRIMEILKNDFMCIPFSHQDLDITNKDTVDHTIRNLQFDTLLHLAAYTNVDGAEKDRNRARDINVTGTEHLFNATRERGNHFIYISTDFVFDGSNPPYDEDSIAHPVGYYGKTKYEGEQVVKSEGTIVRISYPYGNSPSGKPDFVTRIKQLLEAGKELNMITDGSMTPTHIDDIAHALKYLIEHPQNEIFHIVGSQSISPFESGQMIAKRFNLPLDLIKPTTYAEYMNGKALRPQYSETKSKKNTFTAMKSFEEGLLMKD